MNNINKKKLFSYLAFLVSLLVVGIYVMSFFMRDYIQAFLTGEAESYGFFFIFFLSAFLEFFPQYIAPHIVLFNIDLFGFSISKFLFLAILGSAFGSLVGFEIGRKYGIRIPCELFGKEKISSVEGKLNTYGRLFVTVAAFSPLPYVPIIFGSLGMSRKNFFWFGMIPRAISFIVITFVLF